MNMWTAKEKSLTYDQAKEDAARAQKDIKMVNNSLIFILKNHPHSMKWSSSNEHITEV